MLVSPITRAYGYYFCHNILNRCKAILRKLRKPVYLIGGLLLLAYFVFLFFQARFPFVNILTALVAAQVFLPWLFLPFGSNKQIGSVLSFKLPEVQQLFAAPISHQRLLQFKLIQVQFGSLTGALLFAMFVRRVEGVHFLFLLSGLWLINNIVVLQNSLIYVYTNHLKERGNEHIIWLIWIGVLLLLGSVPFFAWQQLGYTADAIWPYLDTPVVRVLMSPVDFLMQPVLAGNGTTFLQTVFLPLALWAVLLALFLRLRFSLGDNALVTAEKFEELKKYGISALRKRKPAETTVKSSSRLQQLSPTGAHWKAVVWKNVLSILRISPGLLKRLGIYLTLCIVVALLLPPFWRNSMALILLGLSAYISLLAPALIRVDLRMDIPHFDYIKSLPISGRQLIFGEVFGSQIVLFLAQMALVFAAVLLLTSMGKRDITMEIRLYALAVAVPTLFSLNFFFLTIQNLVALFFPSFTQFGRVAKAGMEHMGQNMVGALIRMLAMLAAMIIPALIVGIVFALCYFLLSMHPRWIVLICAWVGSITLFLEGFLLIILSEPRYLKFDISSENINTE